LSQEIGWFDTCGASELSTKVADTTGKIQDGLGRKAGDLIQYVTQVIASFVVGLYLCWKLTVVLLAAFPLIGAAGWFMITAITSAQNESMGQYAAAGGLASESLNSVRTVTALNAQPRSVPRAVVHDQ
jgi:ATP-binding cassette, subfamily B (MDR/TAP), member 1